MIIKDFQIDEQSKKHDNLQHYCSLDTLGIILKEKTLKLNNLSYVNDRNEVRRKGIEKFANKTFVSCFSHYSTEIVPFWLNYGGDINNQKVMISLPNLGSRFSDIIHLDYFFTNDSNRMYFDSKTDSFPNVKTIKEGVDISGTAFNFKVKDIEYRPIEDEVFHKSYCTLDYDDIPAVFVNGNKLPKSDIRELGYYKTNHWEYERETRVILKILTFNLYEYILLRLRDIFFMNMKIIVNPWSDQSFFEQVKSIVSESNLSEEIRNSITIKKSELHGTIKS